MEVPMRLPPQAGPGGGSVRNLSVTQHMVMIAGELAKNNENPRNPQTGKPWVQCPPGALYTSKYISYSSGVGRRRAGVISSSFLSLM